MYARIALGLAWVLSIALAAAIARAEPANTKPHVVARFGAWTVLRRQAHFTLALPGESGTHTVCGAHLPTEGGSIVFEVRSRDPWGGAVVVGDRIYPARTSRLTLTSGDRTLRLVARYGGRVIAATNHAFGSGRTLPLDDLLALAAAGKPVAVSDDRLRRLVAIANDGGDFGRALAGALGCARE